MEHEICEGEPWASFLPVIPESEQDIADLYSVDPKFDQSLAGEVICSNLRFHCIPHRLLEFLYLR